MLKKTVFLAELSPEGGDFKWDPFWSFFEGKGEWESHDLLVCGDQGGEHGGGGGEGGAGQPDGGQADHHVGPARLGSQGSHYRLPPVYTDGQEGEDRAGDCQVGDEVVDLTVNRTEYPISAD